MKKCKTIFGNSRAAKAPAGKTVIAAIRETPPRLGQAVLDGALGGQAAVTRPNGFSAKADNPTSVRPNFFEIVAVQAPEFIRR